MGEMTLKELKKEKKRRIKKKEKEKGIPEKTGKNKNRSEERKNMVYQRQTATSG